MPVITTRSEFMTLAGQRLTEAKILLAQQQWDGAYYLAGYAVECAIKAIIIKKMMTSDAYPDRANVDRFLQHDLRKLLQLAELENELGHDAGVVPWWDIVKEWSEQSRYTVGKSQPEAEKLLEATESKVLPWLKSRW